MPRPDVWPLLWESLSKGTLGLLLDAKKAGLLASVGPVLDRLQSLGFRLDPRTRAAVLRLSGEAS